MLEVLYFFVKIFEQHCFSGSSRYVQNFYRELFVFGLLLKPLKGWQAVLSPNSFVGLILWNVVVIFLSIGLILLAITLFLAVIIGTASTEFIVIIGEFLVILLLEFRWVNIFTRLLVVESPIEIKAVLVEEESLIIVV